MTIDSPEIEVHHPDPQPDYVKGLAWTMGFNALMKIVVGVVGVYIARRLGPDLMGMYGVLLNIYIFAEQMREAGLKQAFYNDSEVTPAKFRTYARLSVISGLSFGIMLSLLSHPLAQFFELPQLSWSVIWAAFATFLNGLSVIPMAALHKSGRFRDVGLIETVSNFASAAVSITLVVMGWGFEALVAQLVVRSGLTFTFAYWQKPYSILRYDPKAARAILRVCTPLVATDVLWLLYSLLDQFAIVKLLSHFPKTKAIAVTSNGYYQQGKKILSIPGDFIFFPLFRTVAVALGNRSGDPEHLGRTFGKAVCLSVLLLVSMFGASAALGKPLILALLTAKFAGTIPIFGIICLSEAFKMTGSFAGSALVAAKRSKVPLYAWFLPYPIAALGIAISWSHISLVTIAWSYAAGMIAVNIVVIAAAFRILHVARIQKRRFVESIAIALVTTAAAYAMSFLPLGPWPLVFLSLAVIPAFHLAIIGTVFAGNPVAFFAKNAFSKLRDSL